MKKSNTVKVEDVVAQVEVQEQQEVNDVVFIDELEVELVEEVEEELEVELNSAAAIIAKHGNISKAMRALSAQGMTTGAIAKLLNKRYQHVRNVLITPVAKK